MDIVICYHLVLSMIIQTVDGERKVADDVKTDPGMFLIIMIIMTIETNIMNPSKKTEK